jgi:hypothetical protein
MKWINTNTSLPESTDSRETGAEYFLVWVDSYGSELAMLLDNKWMSDYTSEIVAPVTHWAKISNPQDKPTMSERSLKSKFNV